MNRINCILAAFFLMLTGMTQVQGQTRKYISNFDFFQSYYNPGLTGYEGSAVRGFVRSQWSGVDGAPKSYFFSTELDFGEMAGEEDPALMGKNAVSLNLMHDTYGAFRETELTVGYASRIRLTAKHNLRLGAAVNYQAIRLDGNALTTEEQNDPTLSQYAGQFSNMNVLDFNLGIALTHDSYYFSYGIRRVNGGNITSGEEFMEAYPASSVFQAGYRSAVSDNISVILNAMYSTQKDQDENFEFNFKTVLMDRLWLGLGHRIDYATNAQLGVITKRFRIGYLYEFPNGSSYNLPGNTHEFTAVFNLFRDNVRTDTQQVVMW
ncbi:type IX secretion system membrane protein PorP/SprF [Algoriphagus halophytocola]|uniref:Type IX secretion system membrane protein PorP/SprF n=1 Tax=Algoriphagus halophytocola TaxID=2991499 RepID=A0ABY6MMB9_9BACT|nr:MULTISPECIES: type IX secretion system membrane protein PorP/SprF [unclassified Algoriphagus]UZD24134.1 type IX secretion system membrane protein PorP/SprF [Algoriphagus sp. TR-M5]WBL41505.1 type IX secretion system membrane protein PorP/SprF [Algoriphagus sp. TR-M9]